MRASADRRHAIVVGDGEAPDRSELDAVWPGWDDDAAVVVAADGGARLAERLGLPIDAWVGDGDSLDEPAIERLAAAGVEVRRVGEAKDESDLELALLEAIDRGATEVTIVGGTGGRLDHTLANIGLLGHPRLDARPARLLDARTRIGLVTGPGPDGEPVESVLRGEAGDIVSLLPQSEIVEGVTTAGLEYPLRDEPLKAGPARGLSNVRVAQVARVTIRTGRLLVVETPATLPP